VGIGTELAAVEVLPDVIVPLVSALAGGAAGVFGAIFTRKGQQAVAETALRQAAQDRFVAGQGQKRAAYNEFYEAARAAQNASGDNDKLETYVLKWAQAHMVAYDAGRAALAKYSSGPPPAGDDAAWTELVAQLSADVDQTK
jgi:hypothetical protein